MSTENPTILAYPHTPIIGPAAAPRDQSGDSTDFPFLGVYQSETTQRFTLGTRYITWDGRVYKYGLANGTLNPDVGAEHLTPQEIAYASVQADAAAGENQLKFTVAGTDGAAGDGAIAANELAGGYLVLFDSGSKAFMRGVIGNDAVAATGGTITVDIDVPLHLAVTTSDSGEVVSSPYRNVTAGSSTSASIVGIPTNIATSAEYCWLQTWGPIWVAPQNNLGAGGNQAQGVFRHDGSVDCHQKNSQGGVTYTDYAQHAGFVLSYAQAGTQGAPFFMLQISI